MVRVVSDGEELTKNELDDEIDKRVLAAEIRIAAQLKLWFLTGLLGLAVTCAAGFGSVVYSLGKLSVQFDTQITEVTELTDSARKRGYWMERKDALDDDLIRWAKTKGYEPPAWYRGKDADSTGN